MGTLISLVCAECGDRFDKPKAEHTRRTKRGQDRFFCSQSCQVSCANRESPRGSAAHLNAGNRRDRYTPFRWFMARVRNRKRHGPSDLSLGYLLRLWKRQRGLCPFTGWDLKLPTSTQGWDEKHPANASLDRIDCRRGYVKGNVRFVSIMANLARQDFTDDQLREFCAAVAET